MKSRGLETFDRWCGRVNLATEIVVGLLLGATVCVTFLQVVFRYVLDSSLSWSEEFSRYVFIWIIFLGTAAAVRRAEHMAVDALVDRLSPRGRRWADVAIALIGVAFFALFTWVAYLLTHNALGQRSSGLEISIAWVYAAGPVGGALTLLQLANAIVRGLAGIEAQRKSWASALE